MSWPTYVVEASGTEHGRDARDPGVCPSCGSENDPFYSYCRSCVRRLPARNAE